MGRSLSNALRLTFAILSIWNISGCGKSTKAGPPLFPAKVNLLPSANTSVNLGATFAFTASAQTASGTNLTTSFTFVSSDTCDFERRPQRLRVRRTLGHGFHHLHPRGYGCRSGHRLGSRSIQCPHFCLRPSRHRPRHRNRNLARQCAGSGTLPIAESVDGTRGPRIQSGFGHYLLRRPLYLDGAKPSGGKSGADRQHCFQLCHEPGVGDGSHSWNDPDLRIRQRGFEFLVSTAAIPEFRSHLSSS